MEEEQANLKPIPTRFPIPPDNTLKITFAGDIEMDRKIWNVRDTKIAWQTGKNLTLDEQTEEILAAIRDPQPKHIVVMCFQAFIVDYSTTEIFTQIQTITDLALKSPHIKLVFSTLPFIPELEHIWRNSGDVNDYIRVKNIRDLQTSPLSTHKSLMVSKKGSQTQQCKGKYWQEFIDGTGVGTRLSFEGQVKIAKWIIRHFDTAFTDEDRPRGVDHLKELVPKPLRFTACYKLSPKMRNILQQKEDKRIQVRSRSRTGAMLASGKPKPTEERRHSTGTNQFKDDQRRLPRHVSYNGSGNEPNFKIEVVAQKFDKKWATNNADKQKRSRQPDEVFTTAEEADARDWAEEVEDNEKERRLAEWEETRKVTTVDSEGDEDDNNVVPKDDEKVEILLEDLKDLHRDFNKMECDRAEYKAKIEALESQNTKQSGRLELLEAETQGDMEEIKWLRKKLMKTEAELETMTHKYETQMAIRDEVNSFFKYMKKATKDVLDQEKEKPKKKKD